ncbi:MAG TPA: class I SAM-dependent methyltransferase [Acidimicrobiales bacterium]|nr:class I SAM-dependent methyltransferase [Acidimicrobiales bacterium]
MRDERVALHLPPGSYDVDGFKAGRPALLPLEVDELGTLDGSRLVHLQCHFGLETLDLVRMHPTLNAVGVDFSALAVSEARKLASELGLSERAAFVEAEVYDSPQHVRGDADVVYTGKGALNWLPHLDRWAEVCAGLLTPGGWLYVCEFHPVSTVLGRDKPEPVGDYFEHEPFYSDAPAKSDVRFEWQHTLAEVIDAVLGAGLELRFLHEWGFTVSPFASWLVKGGDGLYRWPGKGSLPLMYSLKARKPPSF